MKRPATVKSPLFSGLPQEAETFACLCRSLQVFSLSTMQAQPPWGFPNGASLECEKRLGAGLTKRSNLHNPNTHCTDQPSGLARDNGLEGGPFREPGWWGTNRVWSYSLQPVAFATVFFSNCSPSRVRPFPDTTSLSSQGIPITLLPIMVPMAPARDIIISIHPQHVANIVSRAKNHEFRNYLLPPSVKRLWIYETSPTSAVKYVATISHGKRPGEIRDPNGLRNDEFDRGDLEGRVKYGYEIRKLEELMSPYTLKDLKRNGWLNGAPQKYCFVKPSMDEALEAAPLRLVFDSTAATTASPRNDEDVEPPVSDVVVKSKNSVY